MLFFDALPRINPWDFGVTNVLCYLTIVLRELLPLDSTLPIFIVQTFSRRKEKFKRKLSAFNCLRKFGGRALYIQT